MKQRMKLQTIAIMATLGLISVHLLGCGGSDSGSESFQTSKALGQTVMTMVLGFAPTPIVQASQAAQTTKATTSCANGGSMSVGPDGSITFYNCSFADGLLFNGTIQITPQGGTSQGGRIEFDNFSGTIDDETAFEMDGYIEETENADGSLDFNVDLDTTTTFMGEPNIFNIEGDFSIADDGAMSGSMLIDNGSSDQPNTLCNFDGANAFDFISEEGTQGGALMDQSCEELETPFS